jgi:hypothetical protein
MDDLHINVFKVSLKGPINQCGSNKGTQKSPRNEINMETITIQFDDYDVGCSEFCCPAQGLKVFV